MIRHALTVFFLFFIAVSAAHATHSVNAVLGDQSWQAAHDGPPARADEVVRIKTHLAFVLAALRARDVSSLPLPAQRARAAALDDLARYLHRGLFPRRTADAYTGRRPRFIDDRGVHCAVGQLIADSGAPQLARAIDARHEYAYVEQMREPALIDWAATHGFTVRELAMIQPTYADDGPYTKVAALSDISAWTEPLTLDCGKQHAPPPRIAVRVAGYKSASMKLSSLSADSFAQCFVKKTNDRVNAYHAPEVREPDFTFDIDVPIPSPQAQLDKQLAAWNPDARCWPRPGELARQAKVELVSSAAGLVAHVATQPQNDEVARCLKREAADHFRDFGAGAWSLRAARTLTLTPRLTRLRDDIMRYGTEDVPDCEPTPKKNATAKIAVIARIGDDKLDIAVEGAEPFASCLRDKLQRRLIASYSVNRLLKSGAEEKYFRVDADVSSTVKIHLETKAERAHRHKQQLLDKLNRNPYE